MRLWLHAVRPAGSVLQEGVGAAGGPLHQCEAFGLQVVYERCATEPEVTRARVLAFGDVVQRLCVTHDALPFRYGATVPTEQALLELLRTRADEWTRRLHAIQGQCEFIVHVAVPTSSDAPARTGTAYLVARAEALRRTTRLEASLSTALAPGCADVRRLPAPSGATRLACLAPPEFASELQARIDRWCSSHRLTQPRVTGPWPPFSFAEEVAAP